MANWGNTKISKENNVKVISHERIRDTNPETYRQRGRIYLERGEYREAEQAYLQAMKLAGKNDSDLHELCYIWYKSGDKSMEAKADLVYNDWWWRQGECKVLFYFILCFFTFPLAFSGMIGALFGGVIHLLLYGPVCFSLYPPNKAYAAHVRRDLGYGFGGLLLSTIIALALGLAAIILANTDTVIELPRFFSLLNFIISIFLLIQKPVGIAFGIVFLYSFHKGISVMQEGVRQWKTAFLRKFFGRILTIIRIAGTIAMLAISVVLVCGRTF